YGKMGRLVELAATAAKHTVGVIIDPKQPHKKITSSVLADVDICIDFTHPSQVLNNIKVVASIGKPMIIGTTGWSDHLTEVKTIVDKSQIGFLYAPNFS